MAKTNGVPTNYEEAFIDIKDQNKIYASIIAQEEIDMERTIRFLENLHSKMYPN